MKYCYSLLFGFVFLFHSAVGQTNAEFGVKGGLNLTFFKVTEASFGDNIETDTGFYLGTFMEFPIDAFFSIQPEALYVGIGDFNFINVPIYAKYEVGRNFHLMAGPSINYFFDLFNAKLKIGADISTSYDLTPKLDAHIKFALGFEEISPNGLFFGLGYKL